MGVRGGYYVTQEKIFTPEINLRLPRPAHRRTLLLRLLRPVHNDDEESPKGARKSEEEQMKTSRLRFNSLGCCPKQAIG
jgi:hypothetical protein